MTLALRLVRLHGQGADQEANPGHRSSTHGRGWHRTGEEPRQRLEADPAVSDVGQNLVATASHLGLIVAPGRK